MSRTVEQLESDPDTFTRLPNNGTTPVFMFYFAGTPYYAYVRDDEINVKNQQFHYIFHISHQMPVAMYPESVRIYLAGRDNGIDAGYQVGKNSLRTDIKQLLSID